MPFTRAELASYRDRTVEDLLGEDVRLLFVGINPGLWTAATGAHFAHPGNRFYPALVAAGILEQPLRVSEGMADADRRTLIDRGVGITNLASRATARADELTPDELRAGAERLVRTVERIRPRAVAMVGITAYRAAFGRAWRGRADRRSRSAESRSGCSRTPAVSTRTTPSRRSVARTASPPLPPDWCPRNSPRSAEVAEFHEYA